MSILAKVKDPDDTALERLVELDRRYLASNMAVAVVVAITSVFFVGPYGWGFVAASNVPLLSGLIGVAFLKDRIGLVQWHVVHLAALSLCMVAAASMTGGTTSALFQIFPAIGLLMVTYFPENRSSLAVAPLAIAAVVAIGALVQPDPIDPFAAVATLTASLIMPLVVLRLVETELMHRRKSVIDHLTGCLNRHALATRSSELQAQLDGSDDVVGVIVIDVDHFKTINDTYGHAEGDEVLKELCTQVRQRLRRFELFYRIGGEEFAVLLAGADAAESQILAEKIHEAARLVDVRGKPLTVSCGIAVAARNQSIERTMVLADKAMYRAKQLGRNRTEVIFNDRRTSQPRP